MQSVPVGTKNEGEGTPRRAPAAKDGLIGQYDEKISTMVEAMRWAIDKFPNQPAMGYRVQLPDKK